MKRTAALILAILFLLPCLCCGKAPAGGQEQDQSAELTTPKPYEPGMTYHEVFNPDTDYDNRFGRGYPGFAETEDAYYVIFSGHTDETGFSSGNYLYFSDKATGEYGLLCGKPECTHNDSSCNARIMGRAGTLSCAGGRLFYIVESDAKNRPAGIGSASCFSIALDGTDRRREFEMPCEWENTPQFFYCHRGKFYGCGFSNIITDGEVGFHLSVTAWDPETDGYTVICSRDDCAPSYCPKTFFFGKYLYFCFDSRTGFEMFAGKKTTLEVWRWDTEVEVLEPVYIAEPGTSSGSVFNLWVESEDRVYAAPNIPDPDGPYAVFMIGGGELSEACRFEGSGGGISILDGVFQRHYIHNEEQTLEVELIDFDGSPIYWGRLDMSFIGEAVPGAVFTSFHTAFGGRDAVYYALTADTEDGTEFEFIVKYEFGGPGEEPVRTLICVDSYDL